MAAVGVPREDMAATVAEVFADLGAAALYRADGSGDGVACRAVPRTVDIVQPGIFPAQVEQTGRAMALLTSEISDRPVKGATIEILAGGDALAGIFPVMEDASCEDRFQLIWLARVGEPS